MAFVLSEKSKKRLTDVHPVLVEIVETAIGVSEVDFMVVEGVRTREKCWEYFGKGRTAAHCRAMGVPEKYARPGEARVTWLRDPLASKHVKQADGYGHAVDLLPAPYDWKETKPFDLVAKAIEKATAIVNERRAKDGHAPVSVRWGADWDKDGKPRERGESDSPHFELA